jgi:prepilin-type N-terminal cleavage/methylation domain-containing protein
MPGRGRPPGSRPGASPAGFTLVELLFAVGVVAIVFAAAVGQTLATLDASRSLAAARFLAGRMALARSQAAARGATVALRFEPRPEGVVFDVLVDGNQNGVRTADVQSQIDRRIEPPLLIAHQFPGVVVELSLDQEPPAGGLIMSFTPAGTATSGTVYVRGRDGTRHAVRVFGPTARTRVLRFDPRTGSFVDLLLP